MNLVFLFFFNSFFSLGCLEILLTLWSGVFNSNYAFLVSVMVRYYSYISSVQLFRLQYFNKLIMFHVAKGLIVVNRADKSFLVHVQHFHIRILNAKSISLVPYPFRNPNCTSPIPCSSFLYILL